jgi:signal transduction histidine kinase
MLVKDIELSDRQLEPLLDVARSLVSELDIETVLRQVLEAARDLTGARYAALGVLDHQRQELERFITLGVDDETRAKIGPLPRGRGVLGELIRHPEPLRLVDVSTHPRSFGFPAGHPPMQSFLGAPIMIGGEAWGNLYLAEKAESKEFDETDERLATVLTEWAAVAINNARLYDQAERRGTELQRVVRGLEAGAEISRAATGGVVFERMTELVAKRARDLVDARTVLVLLPEGDDLILAATSAAGPTGDLGHRIPAGEPVLAHALGSAGPLRFSQRDVGPHEFAGLGMTATRFLFAPLEFRGGKRGLLVAADRMDGGEFDNEDERLLGSFAGSAATTLTTARSVEAEKLHLSIQASEQERRRWARELHDETLQELGSLRVMHGAAGRAPSWEQARETMEQATQYLDRAIANLRSLISELRPASLDELGAAPAIEALVRRIADSHDVAVTSKVDLAFERERAGRRLGAELEVTIYRMVQEGLNNAVKHASAESIELTVLEEGDRITVRIRDDGSGFDPDAVNGGFGLVGMRERVSLLDGSLRIESAPGKGTEITADLPVATAEQVLTS